VVQQFYIYATGNNEPNACAVQRIADRWKAKDYAFPELWTELVTANVYRTRR
jgi:hypothetical protein